MAVQGRSEELRGRPGGASPIHTRRGSLLLSGDGAEGYADGVTRYHELDAAILLTARGGVVRCDGIGFAHSGGGNVGGGDSLFGQEIAHGIGALLGELLIVVVGADAIGVAFQLELEARICQEDSRDLGHFLAGTGLQGIFVEIEEHVVDVDDQTASGFAGFKDGVQLGFEAFAHLLFFGFGGEALGVGFGGGLLGAFGLSLGLLLLLEGGSAGGIGGGTGGIGGGLILIGLGGGGFGIAAGLFGGGALGIGCLSVGLRLLGSGLGLLRIGLRQFGGGALGGYLLFLEAAFVGQFLIFHFAVGDDAGVFGHLGGFASVSLDGFAAVVTHEILGVLEGDDGFLKSLPGVFFGAGEACDLDGIFGFGELQRSFRFDFHGLVGGGIEDVLTALEEFVFGVHVLDGAGGIVTDEIFHDHDVARLGDGEIRLGGDDQAEDLERGGGEEAAVIAVEGKLTEILGAALGGDGPQDISKIFGAELVGRGDMVDVDVDFGGAHLAFYAGFAASGRQQFGAAEVDLGGAAAMVIVDRTDRAGNYGDAEDGHRLTGLNGRHGGLLRGIGHLRAQSGECGEKYCCCFHFCNPPGNVKQARHPCVGEYWSSGYRRDGGETGTSGAVRLVCRFDEMTPYFHIGDESTPLRSCLCLK